MQDISPNSSRFAHTLAALFPPRKVFVRLSYLQQSYERTAGEGSWSRYFKSWADCVQTACSQPSSTLRFVQIKDQSGNGREAWICSLTRLGHAGLHDIVEHTRRMDIAVLAKMWAMRQSEHVDPYPDSTTSSELHELQRVLRKHEDCCEVSSKGVRINNIDDHRRSVDGDAYHYRPSKSTPPVSSQRDPDDAAFKRKRVNSPTSMLETLSNSRRQSRSASPVREPKAKRRSESSSSISASRVKKEPVDLFKYTPFSAQTHESPSPASTTIKVKIREQPPVKDPELIKAFRVLYGCHATVVHPPGTSLFGVTNPLLRGVGGLKNVSGGKGGAWAS
ncbi:uncharacterized protein SPPG_04305 [Spizellomyces punctatus DAOM BR117]|uniref:Uncharacterized protein n=1 Tax=Spizellomyces punctatus (strain DAOM BR117) TaxID=645134 RepID=A0A0L0HK63_SPIPD|nr:uncharacterized protein SPPG_04305 [Spizellomyces punctatus DAOM BR117]KND01214.1 hypothetical protein SPPG_04305 [Spizellomyces punctatus DAOM BR117]|eukprot:XP_016609253.1 hypothetical protein SPPG_04305 [Spizellomyces punctatus DAOM BR117]